MFETTLNERSVLKIKWKIKTEQQKKQINLLNPNNMHVRKCWISFRQYEVQSQTSSKSLKLRLKTWVVWKTWSGSGLFFFKKGWKLSDCQVCYELITVQSLSITPLFALPLILSDLVFILVSSNGNIISGVHMLQLLNSTIMHISFNIVACIHAPGMLPLKRFWLICDLMHSLAFFISYC